MTAFDECTVRFNHGGAFVREGGVKHDDVKVDEFSKDLDKICH